MSALAYNLSRSGDVLLGSRSEGSVGISITMQAGDVWACDSMPLTKTTTVVAQTVLDHGFTTFPRGVPTLGYLKGRIVGRVSPGDFASRCTLDATCTTGMYVRAETIADNSLWRCGSRCTTMIKAAPASGRILEKSFGGRVHRQRTPQPACCHTVFQPATCRRNACLGI